MSVFEKIEAQQKGMENNPAWMVGEQLKEICRREPQSAELVAKDLDAITIADVAKRIKAWADEVHKKQPGNCVCVPPNVAEGIIREAYGLPSGQQQPEPAPAPQPAAPMLLDLSDFL